MAVALVHEPVPLAGILLLAGLSVTPQPWLMTLHGLDEVRGVMVVGHEAISDPARQAFEGTSVVTAYALAMSVGWADQDGPGLAAQIRQAALSVWSSADRMTVLLPLYDQHTAGVLSGLGMALDSYMSIAVEPRNPVGGAGAAHVRPAATCDAEEIVELEIEHVRAQAPTSPFVNDVAWDVPRLAERTAEAVRLGAKFLLAERAGRPAGVVRLKWFDVPDDGKVRRIPPGRAGCVEWVSVLPGHRGTGIGSTLIGAAIDKLVAAGVGLCYVFHGATNPYSTPRFWGRFGFVPAYGTWEWRLQ